MIKGHWYKVRLDDYPTGFIFKAGDKNSSESVVYVDDYHPPKDPGVAALAAIPVARIAELEEVDEPRVFEDGEVIKVTHRHDEPDYYVRVAGYWYLMADYFFADSHVRDYVNKTPEETGLPEEYHSSTLEQAKKALGL